MNESERELVIKLKEHIQELNADIARLMSAPLKLGTVCQQLGERLLINGDSLIDLPERVPNGVEEDGQIKWRKLSKVELKKFAAPGNLLVLNGANQAVECIETELPGMEVTIKRVFVDSPMMEIEAGPTGGAGVIVFKGRVADEVKLGDIVQLDRSGTVGLKIIPKDRTDYSVSVETGICFADIGGQDEAVATLLEAIEGPLKHADLYKAYGKKSLKGVLLAGPPGCGKTLLAKATVSHIAKSHSKAEAATGFIYVKGPEILSMWVGNSESAVRSLFKRAKEHKLEHGYPAVIFVDEAESILAKRGNGIHSGSVLSGTIVPTFLAEMDGLEDSGAFVLLATNRPDILDPAIVREGRIDRKVIVNRPDKAGAEKILAIHLGKTKVTDDIEQIAKKAADDLYSDNHKLYNVGLKGKGVQPFYMRNLVSGAFLAAVVDLATSNAIKRDIGTGKAKPSGMIKDDMRCAIAQLVKQQHNLNHDDALASFAEEQGAAELQAVQRIAA